MLHSSLINTHFPLVVVVAEAAEILNALLFLSAPQRGKEVLRVYCI